MHKRVRKLAAEPVYQQMTTNVAIDSRLLAEAQRVGGYRTKKAAATEALREYIQRRNQLKIVELFGKIGFDPKYLGKQRRKS